jgi:pimeloyl-ACP methyl ester carboxylesterase
MIRAALASVNRPAELVVHRDFIHCGARQVHFRRAGAGPPAIVWSQSIRLSVWLDQLIHRLAPHFTVFVIDLPGHGLSHPLPVEACSVRDLADSLAETLDRLAIQKAVFVGRDIGLPVIVEFALRFPDRVAAAAFESASLRSLPDTAGLIEGDSRAAEPAWDGSHLIGIWARLREAEMFEPWSARTAAARRMVDMPPARAVHDEQFMDLISAAAPAQRIAAAVRAYDASLALGGITIPAMVFGGDDEPFASRLAQGPGLPDNVRLERVAASDRDTIIEGIAEFLLSFTSAKSYEVPAGGESTGSPPGESFVRIRSGSVHLLARCAGDGGGRPLILLHGAGESSRVFADLQRRLARSRRVIAFDLPGHGDSDRILEGYIPRFLAAALAEALDGLDVAEVDFLGRGLGAAIAIELALAEPQRVARVAIVEQPLLSAEERTEFVAAYAPPIEPAWDGAHLVALWNQIRGRELFWPWFKQKKDAIRELEPEVGAAAIHARVHDALRCGAGYAHAHRNWFDWPAQQRFERVQQPLLMVARRGDGWSRDAEAVASGAKRGSVVWVQGDVEDTAAAIERFLDA